MRRLSIFVRRLPFTVGPRELYEYFSKFGHVRRCDIAMDQQTGILKSYGWVDFVLKGSLQETLEKDHYIGGYKIEVQLNKPYNQRAPSQNNEDSV